MRLQVRVGIAGFPVALVVGWLYDIAPKLAWSERYDRRLDEGLERYGDDLRDAGLPG